jgi:hypothetical protein
MYRLIIPERSLCEAVGTVDFDRDATIGTFYLVRFLTVRALANPQGGG